MKFIMLIGCAGSGKTTIGKSLVNENTILLSSDDLRAELFGDENDQKHNKEVFAEMENRTINLLSSGKSVIYDATNLNATRRAHLIDTLNGVFAETAPDLEFIAVAVECYAVEAKARQSKRERKVPFAVIDRQIAQYEKPTYAEGWNRIYFISN